MKGTQRVSIRTLSDIAANTELTVDYGDEREQFECFCNRCRPIVRTALWFGITGTTVERNCIPWLSAKQLSDPTAWKNWLSTFREKNALILGKQRAREFLCISAARKEKTRVYLVSNMPMEDMDPVFHHL